MYQSMNLSFSSNFTNLSFLKPRLYSGISARAPKSLHFKFNPSCVSSGPKSDDSPLSEKLISLLKAVPNWSDGIKERRMQQKRSLYTHENWVRHRSSLRHLRHVSSSPSSRVILSLIPPVFFFTTVAILIAGYNSAVDLDWLPDFFPVLRASPLPYQLTAPALALLLVFRTEASYSRFEQGRKAWVKIISGTNDLARLVISSVHGSGDELIIRDALLRYIVAFPVALKCHVIYGSDIASDLKNVIEEDDLSLILQSKHRPRCVIQFISQSLQLLNLDSTKIDMLVSFLNLLSIFIHLTVISECNSLSIDFGYAL
ncbi:Bestrophin/UPF0187 [Arabidopsis thaliana x Arabidopsis arenosa]|uniref:Bestrophin/UPF0187 n=1 Tax=Arabidopsis thaliana x Arabidopsis arenosa TaxID=1240361 RepID=A0A8T2FU59_9BRAS|nr:Bestrophin/UPF0187 [Arabidopsis thaliana x Arabidopsis arenosa]